MKKVLQKIILLTAAAITVFTGNAQTVAGFDNLLLAPDSYWNGSTTKGGPEDSVKVDTTFLSGDAIFPNIYHKKYKMWSSGWVYSSKKDSTTAGLTNMYSAAAATGYNSANYAVGTDGSTIRLNKNAIGGKIKGVYITNGTYAAISMRDGDQFARKFGDTTGTGSGLPQGSYPDWFKLTIKGYANGSLKNDSVEFYLADYRFDDNSKDYILKTWKWVDLTALGGVDSLIFKLSSSDNSGGWMNTPAYFCIDNFTTEGASNIAGVDKGTVTAYPNPATDQLTIDLSGLNSTGPATLDISDVSGRIVESVAIRSPWIQLPVVSYKPGLYLISIKTSAHIVNAKFIKE